VTRLDLFRRLEWVVAILLSALIIILLVVRTTHAGSLWRDECAVVQLSQMPTIADIAHNFQHEAFPPLFPFIVRSYTAVFGSSDIAFRIFGFCVGCFLISAFWINSRLLGSGAPVLALALVSLSTTFLVWGTTIRGYGLGSALIVLIFGCLGSLLLVWDAQRAAGALFACLLGVQVLLYNSVLLTAVGISGIAVLLLRQRFKHALLLFAICTAAGLSLLPYVPAYLRARDWNILVRGNPTSYSLWKHFEVALGNPGYSIPAVWYSVAIGLIGVFIYRIYKSRNGEALSERHLIWFALLVCAFSIAGCYAFLRLLSYTTSVWYYLAFSCVIAAALDLIASRLCTAVWLRLFRLGFALAALIAAPFADWSALTERQTNIDIAAQTVTAQAVATDLVLVVPWQFGIPFQRYYHGAAPWMTIPNIPDHRVHRYDLFKTKMLSADAITDVEQAIHATLMSGRRVWFVGGLNLPSSGKGPMVLPPAPSSRFKWDNRAYTAAWWQQLSVLVVLHSNPVDSIALPQSEFRINELEQTFLAVVEGWH
jgi:hypothetical protein